ncbi:MAG: cobalamin-independent methionine synthase II family protein [Candidatus Eremiobacteraeota bacterium]|nr:cobalamin-independent methionine synthase II family protein [Candidatus Eremiobacteraeota bacterium]
MIHVDIVGSFLRPEPLKAAFAAHAAGDLSESQLAGAEDEAIGKLIATEERLGLPIVTDGEFRRRQFMESFSVVAGMEPWLQSVLALEEHRRATAAPSPLTQETGNEVRRPVTERLRLVRNKVADEYRYAASLTDRPVKVTLIGPDRLSQRYAYEESTTIYPDAGAFVDDVVRVQREMIAELRDAGCRYVQIDEPGFTSYVDSQRLAAMRSRDEDPDANLSRSIAANNAIVEAFPGVTFGVHLCRGNARSQWHRSGTYDAIAERLFTGLAQQRLLLEYDDERSGNFTPLRFVPKGKVVVLGLITTKRPQLETVDELRRRIDDASRYVPTEQLALSPQCGFASSIEGNLISEDDQWRKIEVMLRTAEAVWGRAATPV